jgi:hypothetical protein
VQVSEELEVVEADPTLSHRLLQHRLVVQEPGQAGKAQGLTLLEMAGVLQPGRHVHVPIRAVFAPGRERPHRHQQGGILRVAGPAHGFDGLTDGHDRLVAPGDLRHHLAGLFEIVDFSGHVPSPHRQVSSCCGSRARPSLSQRHQSTKNWCS